VFERKNSRFFVSGPFDAHMPDYYVIIKDIPWWIKNENLIMSWINTEVQNSNFEFSGVVLSFKKSKDALAFILKWG
jgi:hypothetical protein